MKTFSPSELERIHNVLRKIIEHNCGMIYLTYPDRKAERIDAVFESIGINPHEAIGFLERAKFELLKDTHD